MFGDNLKTNKMIMVAGYLLMISITTFTLS